jgi:hypothetical protein
MLRRDRPNFFALDHIDGNGRKHRQELGGSAIKMYRLAIKKHLSSDLSSLGGRSPREISDKNKIKELLGLPRSVSYPTVIEGAFDPQFLSLLTYLPAPSGVL